MKIIKELYRQKFLCSFLLCAVIGIIISAVGGFRFEYQTNDDYQISFLLYNGETHNLYVNCILSCVLAFLQQLMPFINCFTLFQQLCCFLSIVIITYVFLNKMEPFAGVIVSAAVSSFVFISDILIVQYSQTPTVMCAAGVILAAYAHFLESRKKFKKIQMIISFIFIVTASLFRFAPFLVCAGFSFIFLFSVIFSEYVSTSKAQTFKNRLVITLRKCMSLSLVLIISFSISFAFYFCSEMINASDSNYSNFVEYNNARMRVDDYEIAPYEGNEDFYSSVGIYSQTELSMLGFDKDLYNAQKLNKIADYSEKIVQNGDSKPVYAVKKTIKRLARSVKDIYSGIISIKDKLHLHIENRLFLLFIFILVFGIIVLCVLAMRRLFKNKNIRINRRVQVFNAIIILIWLLFFLTAKINDFNFLVIPLFIIIFTSLYLDKSRNYLAYALFTIAPIILYLYQYNFRISYRVVFTFLFPSIIYLLYIIDVPKIKSVSKNPIQTIAFSLITISLAISSVWLSSFYSQFSLVYNMKLRDYIDSNKSTVFVSGVLANACIDEGYYNSLILPNIPENEVMLGWYKSSDYFENNLKEKQISDVLLDLINSDKRLVLEEDGTVSLDEQKSMYQDFYNIHYFNGHNKITLELETKFNYDTKRDSFGSNIKAIGVYKVVSEY